MLQSMIQDASQQVEAAENALAQTKMASEEQVQSLQDTLQQETAKIEENEGFVNELRSQLDDAQKKIASLEETIVMLKKRIKELEDMLHSIEKEKLKQTSEQDALHEEAAWQAAQARSQLAKEQEQQKMLRIFRVDLCTWLNRELKVTPPLSEEVLLRRLADGIILCQLAEKVDEDETKLRRNENYEDRQPWAKDGAIFDEDSSKLHVEPTNSAKKSPKLVRRAVSMQTPSRKTKTEKHIIEGLDYTPPDATSNLKLLLSHRSITPIQFYRSATPGSEAARQNVRTFLGWANGLGLENPDAFEVDDLVK